MELFSRICVRCGQTRYDDMAPHLSNDLSSLLQGVFYMTKQLLLATLATPVVILAQASTPAPANPISTSQSKMYGMLSGVVIAAAEKMPEANYSFKPVADVRSFGQLVGHLADSQYYFCSSAAGESAPASGIEKSKTSKADLVAALKDSVAYCGKVYAAMTDAKAGEMIKMMNMDFARVTLLSGNTAHDYEHYGNMATYMRIKGIVPPSSEKSSNSEGPK
jgi:uncharacterized damage-inducible protein DinB